LPGREALLAQLFRGLCIKFPNHQNREFLGKNREFPKQIREFALRNESNKSCGHPRR
jgi:hypothetical protein